MRGDRKKSSSPAHLSVAQFVGGAGRFFLKVALARHRGHGGRGGDSHAVAVVASHAGAWALAVDPSLVILVCGSAEAEMWTAAYKGEKGHTGKEARAQKSHVISTIGYRDKRLRVREGVAGLCRSYWADLAFWAKQKLYQPEDIYVFSFSLVQKYV